MSACLSGIHAPAGNSVQVLDGGSNAFASWGLPPWLLVPEQPAVVGKPIEQIAVGDTVVSRDARSGATTYERVVRTTRRVVDRLVVLTLADAGTGRVVQTLQTTEEHPFFVQGVGFVPAGRLALGTSILTRAGPPLVVRAVERRSVPGGVAVYNLEVEGEHSYFVGAANGGAWVHNAHCPTVGEAESAYGAATESYKGGPLSKAGRALSKHNSVSRPGSVFPVPRGGPAAINNVAHDVVGDILRNPRSIRIDRGGVYDIIAPDGRGMRFWASGAFKGFLEP